MIDRKPWTVKSGPVDGNYFESDFGMGIYPANCNLRIRGIESMAPSRFAERFVGHVLRETKESTFDIELYDQEEANAMREQFLLKGCSVVGPDNNFRLTVEKGAS